MKRIFELHQQADAIMSKVKECIEGIQSSQDEDMKNIWITAYKMSMRSYMKCINKITDIYEGRDW